MLHLCMPLRYRIVRQPQAPCRRHGPLTANLPRKARGAPQPHARQFLQPAMLPPPLMSILSP